MSIPALLLSFLLASVYGIAFFLFSGRRWIELALYWVTAVIGFAVGQLVSRLVGLNLLPIGEVSVVEATVTSLIALVLFRMLWQRSK